MTARARREPPPIVDENPPSPPPARRPPPEPVMVDTAVARDEQGLLASMLASGEAPAADTAKMISGLVKLRRRPVDPMTDYVADGTRIPRFVKEAIAHEAAITGLHVQEIMRDVLLGRRQLSPELLDGHFLDLYGYERGAGDR